MTTCGHGSPARGPSPPSCRSGTTSFSRRSPGVSRPDRPRPPPLRSWLLHRLPPPHLPPPSLVLLPPGSPAVGGGRGAWTSSAGRTEWWWYWWPCFWRFWYWCWCWWGSSRGGGVSGSRSCPWRYALAIHQQPMVRAHLDVAVSGSWGGSSSAPAGGHVHRCCYPVRAVLNSTCSAQPATDLVWGVAPSRAGAVLQYHGADTAGQHRVDRRLRCLLPHHT